MFLGGGTAEDRLPYMNHHPKFGIREEALEAGVRTEVQMALNDPRSTPAYDGHPTMNLTSTQKGISVTLVPAAPELPGDGAASSSAAAGTEEGANSSAKKDISILDAWKNRNSMVLGLCLLLNNLVGVGLLTWLATMYSQQFWITPAGWQYMVVMLGYGLSLWIATSTGPGVVKKWFENNEKVFMLIMFVIGAVVDAGGVHDRVRGTGCTARARWSRSVPAPGTPRPARSAGSARGGAQCRRHDTPGRTPRGRGRGRGHHGPARLPAVSPAGKGPVRPRWQRRDRSPSWPVPCPGDRPACSRMRPREGRTRCRA